MTIQEWLEQQLKRLDDPKYQAGFVDGLIAGERRAYEIVLQIVNSQPDAEAQDADH